MRSQEAARGKVRVHPISARSETDYPSLQDSSEAIVAGCCPSMPKERTSVGPDTGGPVVPRNLV